jgi:tRNA (cmo5U34)-methyltransferase
MTDAVRIFAEHAGEYHALRRRLVPQPDASYGTAADLLALRPGPVRRVLDLGAGTGILSAYVAKRHPGVELVLLDAVASMLAQAQQLLAGREIAVAVADLRDPLPEGPFDAVVSALAIHHLDDDAKQDLDARVCEVLRPGSVFVNADEVRGPTSWLAERQREGWLAACRREGASELELTQALADARRSSSRHRDPARLAAQRRLCGCGLFLQALALRRDRRLAAAGRGRGRAERGLTAHYRLTVKWTLFAAAVEPFTPIVAA